MGTEVSACEAEGYTYTGLPGAQLLQVSLSWDEVDACLVATHYH